MLYYLLFWTLLGFIIHFYIIFGTNLLTGGPAQNCCFFAYFSVSKKRNIKRSRNGMKPTGEVIFGREATGKTWSARQERNEGATRQGARPRGACPPPSWPPHGFLDGGSKSPGSYMVRKSRSRRFHSVWTPFDIPFLRNTEIGKKNSNSGLGLRLIG